jgi:hypothetical protein
MNKMNIPAIAVYPADSSICNRSWWKASQAYERIINQMEIVTQGNYMFFLSGLVR